jgi:hypothetical protein
MTDKKILTDREVMEALLAGKKIRAIEWDLAQFPNLPEFCMLEGERLFNFPKRTEISDSLHLNFSFYLYEPPRETMTFLEAFNFLHKKENCINHPVLGRFLKADLVDLHSNRIIINIPFSHIKYLFDNQWSLEPYDAE